MESFLTLVAAPRYLPLYLVLQFIVDAPLLLPLDRRLEPLSSPPVTFPKLEPEE